MKMIGFVVRRRVHSTIAVQVNRCGVRRLLNTSEKENNSNKLPINVIYQKKKILLAWRH